MRLLLLLGLLGCQPSVIARHGDEPVDADRGEHFGDARPGPEQPDASADAGRPTLDPTPGTYRGTCDGSAAVALDLEHFLALSDSDQIARVYRRGATGPALSSSALAIGVSGKADLEDVARVDSRLYAITSHGRTNDGVIDPARYRFVALDVTGAPPRVGITVAASRNRLLEDMLDAASWSTPNAQLLDALASASQLDRPTAAELAPKVNGINLEGLARAPTAATPDRLLIGLRNPRRNNRAIAVTLMNPAAVAAGAAARFGEAFELDLGGLGIRSLAWSDALGAMLVLAGPHDNAGAPFRLFRWSVVASEAPVLVAQLQHAPEAKPEAIVAYPGTRDVAIVFDAEDVPLGGSLCSDTPGANQQFRDLIVSIPDAPPP